jgi:hypothetical protein
VTVLVDGIYLTERERCSHCGGQKRLYPTAGPLCRKCRRRHEKRGKFYFNGNCRSCLETVPDNATLLLPDGPDDR